MKRTTIVLPTDLETQVKTRARELGVSFGEYVRQALRAHVQSNGARVDDPLFHLEPFDAPAPRDLSENIDHYLLGLPKRSKR